MQRFAKIQRVDPSVDFYQRSFEKSHLKHWEDKFIQWQSWLLPLSKMLPWGGTATLTVLRELKWSERQWGNDTMGMIQLNENCKKRLENHTMVRTLPLQLLTYGAAPGGNPGMNYSPSYHGQLSIPYLLNKYLSWFPMWSLFADTCVDLSVNSELERKTQLTGPPPTSNNYLNDRNHFLNSLLGNQEIKHSTACCLVINYDTANRRRF